MRGGRSSLKGQNGYTLVELIIAVAIGALLMSALTSVLLTSWRAATIASSRVEATSQIRNFEYFAYDDFARSAIPNASGCVPATPCTTQPLVLSGLQVTNSTPVPASFQVSYAWDGSNFLDRTVATTDATGHAATNVTAFSWFVDTNATVVVSLTVTVQAYSESQTFRFDPRMNP
ncbi:MAG: type II secretion system protein [Chloroflexi bacterium]|nr:MAG: type II secretion system protein [Chloroflexota bacterium]TME06485.1 MAG: type II secretion system protein [Chloroflexota bacterium]TME43214.1 MAG: type II secretion system protein [Chloroflexota bacterium]TME51579.1 MAG: type II secretion system protein [Chloroflexota bacterium]